MLSLELFEQLFNATVHILCHAAFLSSQFFLYTLQQRLTLRFRHLKAHTGHFITAYPAVSISLGAIGSSVEILKIVFWVMSCFGLEFEAKFGLTAGTEKDWFRSLWSWGIIGFILAKKGIEVKPLPHPFDFAIIITAQQPVIVGVKAEFQSISMNHSREERWKEWNWRGSA